MWEGPITNFGDDLNHWLWPKLLPDFLDADRSTLFIGMGSILYHDYDPTAMKVVFGSGYGGYSRPPIIDEHWRVYFVRGPRTAKILGLDEALGIGDPATLVGTLSQAGALARGTSGPAFMPHWESAIDGSWSRVAQTVGIRYIDPRWPVERVLSEIGCSSVLVSEAMHGAIVADSLRIPWIPFSPIGRHRFKWHDWAESLGIELRFAGSAPSSWLEALLRLFDTDAAMQKRIVFHGRKYDLSVTDRLFLPSAVRALANALRSAPHLSNDAALARSVRSMHDNVGRLLQDFPRRTKPSLHVLL